MDKIRILQKEITDLEKCLIAKRSKLKPLYKQSKNDSANNDHIKILSNPEQNIDLFHSLFRRNQEIFAKRFESKKTEPVRHC